MFAAREVKGGADDGVLSVEIIGARLESRAMEILLQAQPGFTVVNEETTPHGAHVILVLGRDGLAVLQRRRLRSPRRRRQERFALVSNGYDIDFRLARELPIRVFIGADEAIPIFLQGLREAAAGVGFCSPQIVPILVSATAPGAAPAASERSTNAAQERSRTTVRANRPPEPPAYYSARRPEEKTHALAETDAAFAPSRPASAKPAATGGKVPLSESVRQAMRLGLSDREAEIAVQAGQGLSNQQIADAACVTLSTVKFHLYRVYQKLGIERRSQLAALTSGLTSGREEQTLA